MTVRLRPATTPIDTPDPRLRTGAYITDGGSLFQVIEARRVQPSGHVRVRCEDASTGHAHYLTEREILDRWRLVQAAPDVADHAPQEAA